MRAIRKPNHQLTEQDRYKGQIASRERAGLKGHMRQQGMFIDLAGFIMQWRLKDGKGDPPIAQLVRHLRLRGWTGEQGGELSRTEVKRMLATIDGDHKALPAHKAEWNHAMDNGFVVPDAEITSVAIHPEGWLDYRDGALAGWKPSWQDRTPKETDKEVEVERAREQFARSLAERTSPLSDVEVERLKGIFERSMSKLLGSGE